MLGQGNEIELARGVLGGGLDDWPDHAGSVLAEDVVIAGPDGVVYVGIGGWARAYTATVRETAGQELLVDHEEALGRGWVLMRGEARLHHHDGEHVSIPGSWLVRVSDGLIAAIIYYRTETDARAAVDGVAA